LFGTHIDDSTSQVVKVNQEKKEATEYFKKFDRNDFFNIVILE